MLHHLPTLLLLPTLISALLLPPRQPHTKVLSPCHTDEFRLTYYPTLPFFYSAIPSICTSLFPDYKSVVSFPLTHTKIFSIDLADRNPPVLLGAVSNITGDSGASWGACMRAYGIGKSRMFLRQGIVCELWVRRCLLNRIEGGEGYVMRYMGYLFVLGVAYCYRVWVRSSRRFDSVHDEVHNVFFAIPTIV